MRARGHSVWAVPSRSAREPLARLIARLATREGTPSFPPHVTIAGSLEGEPGELTRLVGAVADAHAPLALQLGPCSTSEHWFTCVYYRIRTSATLERVRASLDVRAPWTPHLSLLYGHLTDDRQQALALELSSPPLREFTASSLQLWSTEGPVEDWYSVADFALRGSA